MISGGNMDSVDTAGWGVSLKGHPFDLEEWTATLHKPFDPCEPVACHGVALSRIFGKGLSLADGQRKEKLPAGATSWYGSAGAKVVDLPPSSHTVGPSRSRGRRRR